MQLITHTHLCVCVSLLRHPLIQDKIQLPELLQILCQSVKEEQDIRQRDQGKCYKCARVCVVTKRGRERDTERESAREMDSL